MTDDVFAASRLTIARQRRGLTKKALAERVGVSGVAMTVFENGSRCPSEGTAERLAAELGFPLEFFYGDEIDSIHLGMPSFRSLGSMTARVRDRVLSTGTLAAAVVSPYLQSRFTLPDVQVPDIGSHGMSPAIASADVRDQWTLGEAPIRNLLHLVESKGVHVYWSSEQSLRMDAISFWYDARPYMVLRDGRCGERQRMNIAHELGHLVLHRDFMMGDREAEAQAFAFASSLLLPEAAYGEYFRGASSLGELFAEVFRTKRDWGISAAAALRRCRDIELISEGQYSRACRELSMRKWRKVEPNRLPGEESLLHQKIFQALHGDNILPAQLARELHIALSDLLELMPASEQFQDVEHDAPRQHGHLHLLP